MYQLDWACPKCSCEIPNIKAPTTDSLLWHTWITRASKILNMVALLTDMIIIQNCPVACLSGACKASFSHIQIYSLVKLVVSAPSGYATSRAGSATRRYIPPFGPVVYLQAAGRSIAGDELVIYSSSVATVLCRFMSGWEETVCVRIKHGYTKLRFQLFCIWSLSAGEGTATGNIWEVLRTKDRGI